METRLYCPAAKERAYVAAKNRCIEAFDGVTITDGTGCWRDHVTRKLVEEPVHVLSAFCPAGKAGEMEKIAYRYLMESGEQAVLYTVDGREHFLSANVEELPVAA